VSAAVLSGARARRAARPTRLRLFTASPARWSRISLRRSRATGPAPWIPAVREDVAVGLERRRLAGRAAALAVIHARTPGSARASTRLASLSLMYGSALLIVTWRGLRGPRRPRAHPDGRITPDLLDLLRIPHRTLTSRPTPPSFSPGPRADGRTQEPVALLLPPGVVAAGAERAGAESGGVERRSPATGPDPTRVRRAPAVTTPATEREELTPVDLRAPKPSRWR